MIKLFLTCDVIANTMQMRCYFFVAFATDYNYSNIGTLK